MRHRPEETVLHQVLSAHFEQLVERAEEAEGLPEFVLAEVREYLRCGLLEYGLLHCRCQRCGHDEVCAFICERRGFCPLPNSTEFAGGNPCPPSRMGPASGASACPSQRLTVLLPPPE